MMPLPSQSPSCRPLATFPSVPVYAAPLHDPVCPLVVTTSELLVRSTFAPAAMVTAASLLTPAAAPLGMTRMVPAFTVRLGARRLFTDAVPPPFLTRRNPPELKLLTVTPPPVIT